MTDSVNRFVGVDVQARRCAYAVLDDEGAAIDSGWLAGDTHGQLVDSLLDVALGHSGSIRARVAVGIDAPRQPLPSPRRWYWRRAKLWRACAPTDKGLGRHCDVVLAAHKLASPQWTPCQPPFPEWMQLGFHLFAHLGAQVALHEVFPTASYRLLRGDPSLRISVRLGDFADGPGDILDAHMAAATVREFLHGRGTAVGGGDGLGEIILPRPLPRPIPAVLNWPTA